MPSNPLSEFEQMRELRSSAGVAKSAVPSKIRTLPPCVVISIRPSGRNAIAVGEPTFVTKVSVNPAGSDGCATPGATGRTAPSNASTNPRAHPPILDNAMGRSCQNFARRTPRKNPNCSLPPPEGRVFTSVAGPPPRAGRRNRLAFLLADAESLAPEVRRSWHERKRRGGGAALSGVWDRTG